MPDIVVVGSLNADLVVRSPRFPSPGETIQGEDLATIPGGKGANQAVAAARLGASVAMVGCVGADPFGSTLIENLKRNKVDVRRVLRDGSAATGTAIIIVDSAGQNSIVLSPGANAKVTMEDLEPDMFAGAKLLLLQFEIPLETVMSAARMARRKRVRVILNPAPAHDIPDDLIKLADYLVPNETELGLLSGKHVKDKASLESAVQSLLKRGASNIVVTLGAKGALLMGRSSKVYVPAYKVKPVDTTAAGDAFIGGMAFALARRKSIKDAVQYACACGALATSRFGAQPSLPTAEEVTRLICSD
ncbi:MAG TPA: ribokinase [Anaerolineales bacterium]|nr:ribokinase [Anaerolineales bacterium]